MTNKRKFGSRLLTVGKVLAAMALLAAQPSIAASTMTFTGYEYGSVNVNLGATPTAAVTQDQAGAYNTQIDGGPTFESFCIDVWQFLNFNHAYSLGAGNDYSYRSSMVGYVTRTGTITQQTVDNLSRLYDEAHSSIVNNPTNSAALQLAIWEITFETPGNYNLSSGNFFSTGPSAVTNVVNTWLTNLGSYSATAYTVSGYISPTTQNGPAYQDVITFAPIPEPGTYAMMLAGLGLMGFVARRRQQEGRA